MNIERFFVAHVLPPEARHLGDALQSRWALWSDVDGICDSVDSELHQRWHETPKKRRRKRKQGANKKWSFRSARGERRAWRRQSKPLVLLLTLLTLFVWGTVATVRKPLASIRTRRNC